MIDGDINGINSDSGDFSGGEEVNVQVAVENTGNETNEYFVGYSVHGPNGDIYDNDGATGQTVYLTPGEGDEVTLSWDVESGAPEGQYDTQVSLWEESDSNALETRLDDEWVYGSFSVVEEAEEIDAEVYSTNPSSGVYSSGDSVITTVEVENTGTVEHTFYVGYTVHGPNGGSYDNGETTGQSLPLDANADETVDVEWVVEDDAPAGDYDVQVSVWEESNSNNLQTRLDDEWNYGAFSVEEEAEEIDAKIDWIDPSGGAYADGESVTTTVDVKNTGTVEHTFYVGFTVHGPNGGTYDNDGTTGRTVQLDSNEYDEFALEWEVEGDASPGDYDVQVSVWEENDADNLQTRLADEWEYNAFAVEEETEEVDAEIFAFEPDSGTFSEGDTVATTVDVENTGTVEHTYYLGYTLHGPDGGTYENGGTTGRTIQLESGSYDEFDLEWQVEADAPAGEYDVQVSVWEESDRSDLQTRLADSWEYDAFTLEEGVGDIEAEITSLESVTGPFSAGDSVTTTAKVTNTSMVDHTFFVGYTIQGPDGDTYDNNAETGRTVTVETEDTESVVLEWVVEEDAPEGEYDIQAAIWEEQDRTDLQTRLDEEYLSDVFRVEAGEIKADITAIDPPNGTHREGAEVTTTVEVENVGEAGHTFFLGYSIHGPEGGTYDNNHSTGQTVSVPTEESRTLDLSWTVEEGAPEGKYDIQVAIWKEQDPSDLQTRLDEGWEDNAFSIGGNAEAIIDKIDPDGGTHSEGDLIRTTVRVENVGQAEHEFFIGYTVHGPEGTSYDNDGQTGQPIFIGSQDNETLELEWEVHPEAVGGEYDVEVVVWAESNRDNLTTRLDDASAENAFELTGGANFEYRVDVRDARGNPLSEAEVTLIAATDGSSWTQRSIRGTATFSDVPSGEYRITATSSEVNQSKRVNIHIGEASTRHRIVFEPARPVLGAALGSEGKYLSNNVAIEFANIDEAVTTNGLGLFKTEGRIPLDNHEVSVTPPDTSSTNITFEHRYDSSPLLDLNAAATMEANAYASSIVDENSFTSFVIQYAQSQEDYDSKTLAALHGFVKGLLTGLKDLIEGIEEIAEVVVALVTNLKRALKAILSTFIDVLRNIPNAIDYLIAAVQGIPDAYWDAVDDLVQKQEDDNPHPQQDDVYMPFAILWYIGYTVTGLILGGIAKRIGTAGRQVIQQIDVFEDATSLASRWVRSSGGSDEVSPGLIGTFNNANPDLGRRSGDLPLRGSFQDVGLIKETIESAQYPELVREFVASAHYRNHWMRGKHDAKDPAEDARDSQGRLSGNMKGNVNEELVAASLLKEFDTNRLVSKRTGLSVSDLQADYIWNSFQPSQLAKGESALIRGFEPDVDNDFELDFVRVVRPDTPDGEPSLPIVTHVIEPTSGRGNNIDAGEYRSRKEDHLDNKIPEQINQMDRDFLPGTNLDLHAFLRDGKPELILVKTRDNPDSRFDMEIQVDHDELIETADAIKTADEAGPTGKNLLDNLIQPPDTNE